MKIKNFLLFILIVSLIGGFVGCSDDDEVEPEKKDTTLKLKADKSVIEPFEKLTVSIDLDLDLIYETYDSIAWNANGVHWDGIIYISGGPETDERDSFFTDYELGEHTITIEGYKDRKLLSKDSIKYTVERPTGNFMNIIWGKVKKGSTTANYLGNYLPAHFVEENGSISRKWIEFSLFRNFTSKNNEYATLNFMPWTASGWWRTKSVTSMSNIPKVNDFDWHNEDNTERKKYEYDFFYNYITELYGEHKFIYEGYVPSQTDLNEEYHKRVSEDISRLSSYPIVIWDTPRSHIVLTREEDFYGGQKHPSGCKVVAVPRKNIQ